MRYYVYGHYREDTGELFYIGKGTGNRAWMRNNRSKEWHKIVEACGFIYKIIKDGLDSDEALEFERSLILENRDSLINKYLPSTVNIFKYEDISSMFYYDPSCESGLRWKTDRLNSLGRLRPFKDKLAGSKNGRYWCVEHAGKSIPVHRLVYFLHNPFMDWRLDIDHINGNSFDNNINNLRLVSKQQNMKNRILPSKTGHSFVHRSREGKGRPHYYLLIPIDGKRVAFFFYVHNYSSQDDALAACLTKKNEMKELMLKNGVTERAFNGKD